jgi:hypothetical protein
MFGRKKESPAPAPAPAEVEMQDKKDYSIVAAQDVDVSISLGAPHRRSSGSNLASAIFTELVTETEHHGCCGGETKPAWNRRVVEASALDTIMFRWFVLRGSLTFTSQC